MQILQAIRNVYQLQNISQLPVEGGGVTHKHRAVGMWFHLDELVDVSMIHPLRNHRKSLWSYCYPKEW